MVKAVLRGNVCRHCRKRKAFRARGLCHPCYVEPTIRDLYPPAGFASQVLSNKNWLPLAKHPTRCLPGTPGKLDVMMQRAARGEAIFHPGDARDTDLDPGWDGEKLEENPRNAAKVGLARKGVASTFIPRPPRKRCRVKK